MADLVDVENALVALITQTIYPNGTAQPSATGVPTIIYAGWPTASQLDADLLALSQGQSAGRMHVTVFPPKGMEKNTTRFMRKWVDVVKPVPTLTMTIQPNGVSAQVGGMVSVPQNVMLMVNHRPFVYAVKANDTLASIASALAAMCGGSSVDATVTVSPGANLTAARVGATGKAVQEIRRQEKVFNISVWADTPAHRDVAAQLIDPVLADTEFLVLADQSAGRLIYKSTYVEDFMQKALLYRRDLCYSVEYATFKTATTTQITQTQLNTSGGVPPAESTPVTVFS